MLPKGEISARLKAARWLSGSTSAGDGRPHALTVADLAEMEPLVRNRITRNRLEEIELEEIEQAKVVPREMELEKICEALGLPPDWFSSRDWRLLVWGVNLPPGEAEDNVPPERVIRRRVEQLEGELSELRRRSTTSETHSEESPRASQNQ